MRAHLGDYESLDEKLTSFTARARSTGARSRTSSKSAARKFRRRRLARRTVRG
jgi:hypothetical protein